MLRGNATESPIGARVRALRHARGMTLKALGARAGLSHPFLSQVERGLARPSLGSIERIAGALGVPVGQLWGVPPRPSSSTWLLRRLDAPAERHAQAGAPGGVRELGSPEGALRVREWSGGSRQWPGDAWVSAGDVAIHVVRGALEVDVAGTVQPLEEGDTVVFDGTAPHRLRRTGTPATRALIVTVG